MVRSSWNESLLQTGHFVDNNGLFLIALLMLILGFAIAWVIYAAPLGKSAKRNPTDEL